MGLVSMSSYSRQVTSRFSSFRVEFHEADLVPVERGVAREQVGDGHGALLPESYDGCFIMTHGRLRRRRSAAERADARRGAPLLGGTGADCGASVR